MAFLRGCDHIIHGGDIGNADILTELAKLAPITAVRGNKDRDTCAKTDLPDGPARRTCETHLPDTLARHACQTRWLDTLARHTSQTHLATVWPTYVRGETALQNFVLNLGYILTLHHLALIFHFVLR